MTHRTFTLKDKSAAREYIVYLLDNDIPFAVHPKVDRVEVHTPVELKVADFPNVEWLL